MNHIAAVALATCAMLALFLFWVRSEHFQKPDNSDVMRLYKAELDRRGVSDTRSVVTPDKTQSTAIQTPGAKVPVNVASSVPALLRARMGAIMSTHSALTQQYAAIDALLAKLQ